MEAFGAAAERALRETEQSGMEAAADFWRGEVDLQSRLTISGEFWADAVARLKRGKQYADAVELCRQAMPVPGAYREILICFRKLHGQGTRQERLLGELYRYAVEGDVLTRVPYVEFTTSAGARGLPGFNVSVIVWAWMKERPVRIDYDEIGYDLVATLNKTDRRRLVEAFGEPKAHRDPFDVFLPLWKKGVEELVQREERTDQESKAEWARIRGTPETGAN